MFILKLSGTKKNSNLKQSTNYFRLFYNITFQDMVDQVPPVICIASIYL